MHPLRVLVGSLPHGLQDTVNEVLASMPDIEATAVATNPSGLLHAAGTLRADVVVVATVDGDVPGLATHLLDQKEKHLQVDGIAGPITWPALSVTVRRGSEGDAVRGVQEEIEFRNQSGAPGLPIDGKFGPKTEAAVRGFQQAIAVDMADFPVDGIVGPKTWQAMVSGMLSF